MTEGAVLRQSPRVEDRSVARHRVFRGIRVGPRHRCADRHGHGTRLEREVLYGHGRGLSSGGLPIDQWRCGEGQRRG